MEEVQTSALGCGMDEVLRSVGRFDAGPGAGVNLGWLNGLSGRLNGIVNGIDTEEWDPSTDPHIPARYSLDVSPPRPPTTVAIPDEDADALSSVFSASDFTDGGSIDHRSVDHSSVDSRARVSDDNSAAAAVAAGSVCVDYGAHGTRGFDGVLDYKRGKAACKAALQRELGLHEDPDAPLVGFIGRLDHQKGVDVLLQVVPHIVANGGQVVMLGSGDPHLEGMMRQMESDHRGRAVGWVGFSVPVSHRITAAADILAMPSRFEPCGLNQLYALRYGTIPVAHATGGLKDTVRHDVGFPFSPCGPGELRGAMDRAFACYREGRSEVRGARRCRARRRGGVPANMAFRGPWEKKQVAAMTRDFSWASAAEKYEKVFKGVALPPPPPGASAGLERQHLELGAGVLSMGGDRAIELKEAAAAAHGEEQWVRVTERAERVRRRAGLTPDSDTRALEDADHVQRQSSWTKILPGKLLGALFK